MHMIQKIKVLKKCYLLNANIKTNQEIKITKFKLLKHIFIQIFNQNKEFHLHIRSYAIKDGQISQHIVMCTEFSIDLRVVCATNMCTKHKIGTM